MTVPWPLKFFLLTLLYILFWLSYPHIKSSHHTPVTTPAMLPAWVLNTLSLGNPEAVAESIVFETIFYNEFRAEYDNLRLDLHTTINNLDIASQLDPYNMNCYYYSQAIFGDRLQFIPRLTTILDRGFQHKKEDFYIPFFLGANNYFILGNQAKAAFYFKQAALRLPKSSFYTTLSARMMHEAGESQQAVAFLEEMLLQSKSPLVSNILSIRLQAMQTVVFLENAIDLYKQKTGSMPAHLNDLISTGILRAIPPDPYGGQFFLTAEQTINTTSKFTNNKTVQQ